MTKLVAALAPVTFALVGCTGPMPMESPDTGPDGVRLTWERSREAQGPDSVWGPLPLPIAERLPDWDRLSDVTLGGGGDRYRAWATATVIVMVDAAISGRTFRGHGSGVFVSPDGWILTNYHVVEAHVQLAAVEGGTARVEIITCVEDADRLVRRPGSLTATVQRVSPAHDLALLRIDELPSGYEPLPYVSLADTVNYGEDCFMIGSPGGGPPWLFRRGTISGITSMPGGLGVTLAMSPARLLQRPFADVITTDCSISGGDSGGPLLNAEGRLIGLNFATPLNQASGALAYHVHIKHLHEILTGLPEEPEVVPVDFWKAGLPDAVVESLGPIDLGQDGTVDAVVLRFATRNGAALKQVATATFLSMSPVSIDEESDSQALTLVPRGLWGMAGRGRFPFTLVVLDRTDGMRFVAYVGEGSETIAEIRIDRNGDGITDRVLRRRADAGWSANQPANELGLFELSSLDPGRRELIDEALEATGQGSADEPGSPH